MRDGIVQINARPIRHAFLVDPTDADALQQVIEINTFLWGGKFNAIIPTFQDSPENWYDCDNINSQNIVSGYLNNFDPDCVVPIGKCSDYDLNLGDRSIIDHPSIFLAGTQINGTVAYGISLFETLSHYIKNNEFEFGIMGTPLEICMPRFGNDSCSLLSCFFGSLPEAITEILEQKLQNHLSVELIDISASNYAEYIQDQTDHSPNYLFTDQVRSRRAYLMGINTIGFSSVESTYYCRLRFGVPSYRSLVYCVSCRRELRSVESTYYCRLRFGDPSYRSLVYCVSCRRELRFPTSF